MKEITTINVGKSVFTMEVDAYRMLRRYLDDVARHCEEAVRKDTLEDVEIRMAEIFSEHCRSLQTVVTTSMVREAINTIGPAQSFGEYTDEGEIFKQLRYKKLSLSSQDRIIGGVCGGVSEYFGVESTPVRLLTFALIFFGGVSLWVYLIMWAVMPRHEEQ